MAAFLNSFLSSNFHRIWNHFQFLIIINYYDPFLLLSCFYGNFKLQPIRPKLALVWIIANSKGSSHCIGKVRFGTIDIRSSMTTISCLSLWIAPLRRWLIFIFQNSNNCRRGFYWQIVHSKLFLDPKERFVEYATSLVHLHADFYVICIREKPSN